MSKFVSETNVRKIFNLLKQKFSIKKYTFTRTDTTYIRQGGLTVHISNGILYWVAFFEFKKALTRWNRVQIGSIASWSQPKEYPLIITCLSDITDNEAPAVHIHIKSNGSVIFETYNGENALEWYKGSGCLVL